MNSVDFNKLLLNFFPFETTKGQKILLLKCAEFITGENGTQLFVMKGYAGTGKTTVVSSIVQSLPAINYKAVLLAPTGRAAKVISGYTKKQAFTIHKKIYFKQPTSDGGFVFHLQKNLHANTIFIVDEASMIAIGGGFTNNSLLDDLIEYVYSGVNCKLLLIGDTAQLPPIGLDVSPALDIDFLKASYSYKVDFYELTEVLRQADDSGILHNATLVRNLLNKDSNVQPKFDLSNYKDVVRINGMELEDALNEAYNKFDAEDTIVICRSNKRANIFNQQIRARIRWQEQELSSGDYMMVVKNNYFWLPEESAAGFIANGDIIQITRVGKVQEMYGFRFADVRIKLIDYPNEPELDVRILLDTIMADAPALNNAENKKLFDLVYADYGDIADRRMRLKKVKEDPFFNALQVKFAYAITCHKSQGGQWGCVFVEQGYLTDEMLTNEYLRWLYTAVSRAKEKLYLVNFNKEFFNDEVQ